MSSALPMQKPQALWTIIIATGDMVMVVPAIAMMLAAEAARPSTMTLTGLPKPRRML